MSTSSVVSCQLRARSVSAWTLSTMRLMLFFDGPVAQPGLTSRWRVHPPERIAQEVKLPVRNLADPCLLLVHCQLQLAHDRAPVVQRIRRAAPSAQDHKIVRIADEASAETLLKAELLPPQHKPAHVKIRQQW